VAEGIMTGAMKQDRERQRRESPVQIRVYSKRAGEGRVGRECSPLKILSNEKGQLSGKCAMQFMLSSVCGSRCAQRAASGPSACRVQPTREMVEACGACRAGVRGRVRAVCVRNCGETVCGMR